MPLFVLIFISMLIFLGIITVIVFWGKKISRKTLFILLMFSLALNIFTGWCWYNSSQELNEVISDKTATFTNYHQRSTLALQKALEAIDKPDEFLKAINETEIFFGKVRTTLSVGGYFAGGYAVPSSLISFYDHEGLGPIIDSKGEMENDGEIRTETLEKLSETEVLMRQILNMLDFNPFQVSVSEQYEIFHKIDSLIQKKYH